MLGLLNLGESNDTCLVMLPFFLPTPPLYHLFCIDGKVITSKAFSARWLSYGKCWGNDLKAFPNFHKKASVQEARNMATNIV